MPGTYIAALDPPPSDTAASATSRSRTTVIIACSVGSAVAVAVIIATLLFVLRQRRRRHSDTDEVNADVPASHIVEPWDKANLDALAQERPSSPSALMTEQPNQQQSPVEEVYRHPTNPTRPWDQASGPAPYSCTLADSWPNDTSWPVGSKAVYVMRPF
jgi:hypothetical protein